MPRGLDHIVHAVRDLDAAAALYERLGFTVGARNRHPFGTVNRIVQLPGVYIEILAVEEPDRIVPHGPRAFSFAAFHRDVLARHEGLDMILVAGQDGDAAAFRAAGIGDFDPVDFAREGQRPDGTPVRLGFTLAFAVDPQTPDIAFASCRHHNPENFWDPAFQVHANAAAGIAGVVAVADNPADHHIFLSALTGERDLLATSSGLTVPTPRGDIRVMAPAAFTQHYGVAAPDVASGARLAALRITVRDFAAAVKALQAADVPASVRMGRIIVAPPAAAGATLVFEPG